MSISIRKLGVLGLIGAVLLVFGMLRPGAPSQPSEAAFWSPGGMSALPSFFPGIPGVVDQQVPAMIPASPPGNQALISAFADPFLVFFPDTGAIFDSNCNVSAAGFLDALTSVCFKVQAVDIANGGALVSTAAKFEASGSDRLVCDEWGSCDLTGPGAPIPAVGVISVMLNGGGKDELLTVTATDESGNTRTVGVITVQTMIALPPIVEPSASPLIAGAAGISVIGYRCSDVGKVVTAPPGAAIWFPSSLGDMWNVIYTGLGGTLMAADGPLYGCGQNTIGSTNNLVQFQTDVGQMSLQPLLQSGGIFAIISLALPGFDCPQGKSVSINDGSAWNWNSIGFPPGPPFQMQNCDIDAAPNGTVGYLAVRTADVGQATVTGQQGGVAASTRQTYVNFIGEPSAGIVPTIQLKDKDLKTLPALLLPVLPVEVVALVLNQSLNPLAGKTVTCTVDPKAGMFALLSDRDTTGADGIANFTLVPTAFPGTELTLSCSLDGYPNIPPATHTFTSSLTPDLETVDLVEGCNPLAATWADGTAIAVVAGAVDPAEALDAIWKFDTASGTWQGYSPTAPADVNDLALVARLDAIFICVNAAATVARPVI